MKGATAVVSPMRQAKIENTCAKVVSAPIEASRPSSSQVGSRQ